MNSLRILMIGWEWPPWNSGGLGVACYGLTRALSRQGDEVIFVLPKRLPARADFLKLIFAETDDGSIGNFFSPYGLLNHSSGLIEEVERYVLAVTEIARQEKFDIIHAHDWLTFAAGLAAKKVSGRPLVAHIHATEFDRTGGLSINQEVYLREKAGMEGADKVIAVSVFTKSLISRHYGIDPEKVAVVHNGIDVSDYKLVTAQALRQFRERGYQIVIFVGRLTLQKGPDYFLRAAEIVNRHNDKVIFVVAGSGDMEGQIIAETSRRKLTDKVFFAGFLRGEELASLYRAADLYVLSSVSEPFGITPLEALASGTPVLLSKQSGVAEVLNYALKVDFWDVEEMANQILATLRYGSLHRLLRVGGQREVEKITWEAAARKCHKLYESLI